MTPACHCVRCHGVLECCAVRDDKLIGWVCPNCETVWDIDAGWNPWLNRVDPQLLVPQYG